MYNIFQVYYYFFCIFLCDQRWAKYAVAKKIGRLGSRDEDISLWNVLDYIFSLSV